MAPPAARRRLAGALFLAMLAGCSSGDGNPVATNTPAPAPAVTLPPGPLADQVLQPGDLDVNLVPILAQTGPADIAKIASFSGDPAAAQTALTAHGFQAAYVVQYGDSASGAVLTNVVTSFATEGGARDDLTADLAAAGSGGTPVATDGLGDQAGGINAPLDPTAGTGQLITLRWRVGATTWLLAVGSPQTLDEPAVRSLADLLVTRARD